MKDVSVLDRIEMGEEEITGDMVGCDTDLAAYAEKQEKRREALKIDRKMYERLEREEGKSIRKINLMREGFCAGYEAAASDYANGTATVEHFEAMRQERDLNDAYALGFELGYFRKLAEILVC